MNSERRQEGNLPAEIEKKVDLDIRRYPDGLWMLDIRIGQENPREIPVYHIREDSHKEAIARALISGRPVAAFGVGNYGLAIGVEDPRRGRNPNVWRLFYDFKPERPWEDKIPILLPPKYWEQIIDRKKIHPKFRGLFTHERLSSIYEEAVIFHIVSPTYDWAPHINEKAFITQRGGRKSVSAFFWHDPDLYEIADLAMRFDPQVLIGISSFNDHGEKPAFNFDEVVQYILQKKRVPFDFVIRDEVGEGVGVRSSHPQFQVPEAGDSAEWVVVRKGSVSVEKFLKATGLPYGARETDKTSQAPRDHHPKKNLDDLVGEVKRRTLVDFRRRRSKNI